jgi:nicotinamidase-related amidase
MKQSALLIIDVQQGLDNPCWGERNNPDAETNIAMLLKKWRDHHWPVIHIQHCSTNPISPLRPDLPGNAFKPEALPVAGEPVFRKTVNSAFIGTGLESYLVSAHIRSLVIVGLTTDHCVSTSVRMAANLGFDVFLVRDATATFERWDIDGNHISAHEMQRIHLASLSDEFCRVLTTDEVYDSVS